MKAIVIVILLTLVGCAGKSPQTTFDSRASEYRLELMVQCGEVAATLSEGNGALADKLYGQCLYDMDLTI